VVGLITLTPEQVAAGKVAQFATLSSFDAALIAQKVVALCTNPNNHAGEWKFYAANPLSIADGQSSYSGKDFKAYMLGDVDGSWVTSAVNRPALRHQGEGAANSAVASLPSVTAQPGEAITVPLRIDGLAETGVTSYQFDINYDPAVLTPAQAAAVSLEGTNAGNLSIAFNTTQPGLIKVAVYGAFAATGDGVYANLRFTASGRGVSPLTFADMRLNDDGVPVTVTDGQVNVGAGDYAINGRVLSLSGTPVANATVFLAGTAAQVRRVTTDAQGRFTVASLAPGDTYQITAQARLHKFTPVTVSLTEPVTQVEIRSVSPDPIGQE
jgi:hypothetical protein